MPRLLLLDSMAHSGKTATSQASDSKKSANGIGNFGTDDMDARVSEMATWIFIYRIKKISPAGAVSFRALLRGVGLSKHVLLKMCLGT